MSFTSFTAILGLCKVENNKIGICFRSNISGTVKWEPTVNNLEQYFIGVYQGEKFAANIVHFLSQEMINYKIFGDIPYVSGIIYGVREKIKEILCESKKVCYEPSPFYLEPILEENNEIFMEYLKNNF